MISLEQTDLVGELAMWLVAMLDPAPGWRGAWVELKPTADRVWVQVHSETDGAPTQDFGGDIKPESSAVPAARRLQEVCYQPGVGTWISALIEVRPTGPQTVSRHGMFNYEKDPGCIAGDDGELDAEELVGHLRRYPRQRQHIPQWMRDRIEQGGLSVPAAD